MQKKYSFVYCKLLHVLAIIYNCFRKQNHFSEPNDYEQVLHLKQINIVTNLIVTQILSRSVRKQAHLTTSPWGMVSYIFWEYHR